MLLMEERNFVQYKHKHMGVSSEKVNRYFFHGKNIVNQQSFPCFKLSVVFKSTFFCSMKPQFLLQIDSSGIINCNTFSVVPSVINENAKMCCSILQRSKLVCHCKSLPPKSNICWQGQQTTLRWKSSGVDLIELFWCRFKFYEIDPSKWLLLGGLQSSL